MSLSPASANANQIELWNGPSGATWTAFQDQLDRQLYELGAEAMRALGPKSGDRILDIGCGCGHTSLQLAERVGGTGAVVGVDISKPMLEVARNRPVAGGAAKPEFRQLDAQSGDLGAATFDAAFSRFGVMFFADPTAAFANIAGALKPGGRLAFVCWRPFEQNLWMREPFEAALPYLPPRPPIDPLAPGPFAFASSDRIQTILTDAGFSGISIDPFDTMLGRSAFDEAVQLTFKVGPLGAALRENPDSAAGVVDAVKTVLSGYLTPEGIVQMPAAVWIVRAQVG